MSNPKISVIIPCYGVERYVGNLYMDLTKQSFSDIEMIFINDGGGDLSCIIHRLASEDVRVIAVDKIWQDSRFFGTSRNREY